MTESPRFHVSFICSGNICRSPYAEALLRKIAGDEGWTSLAVSSAGTLGIVDAPADATTIALGAGHGLNLVTHRSRGIDDAYLSSCDLVLCMSKDHVELLRTHFPIHEERIYLLGSYPAHDLEGAEVPDPVGLDEESFERSHEVIHEAMDRVVAEIRERWDPGDRADRIP